MKVTVRRLGLVVLFLLSFCFFTVSSPATIFAKDQERATTTKDKTSSDTPPQAPSDSKEDKAASDSKGSKKDKGLTPEATALTSVATTGSSGSGTGAGGISTPSFQVSEFSGAAVGKIPIIVPPGRNGIQPNLSLVYNSNHKNGWVGVGWDLDMGAIQRSTKHGVNYSASEYVATMSGSTSEIVPRSEWGPSHYGAKVEEVFSKYYLNPSTGGWEVTTKDGTTYNYGTTAASRQDNAYGIFKWCLDRVEDTNGNYMSVSYTKDQGEIYLDRIDYTGSVGLSPSNYVKFYLEERPDVNLMYTTNFLIKTAKRLKTIEVKSNETISRGYKLSYTTSAKTSRSLLSSIQQAGSDAQIDQSNGTISGGTLFTPIVASYQQESDGTFSVGPEVVIGQAGSFRLYTGDFNGDGKADVLEVYNYDNRAYVRTSNGDGTFTLGPEQSIGYGNGFAHLIGDFNGDGKADVLEVWNSGPRAWVLMSRGDGTFMRGPETVIGQANDFKHLVGDFNGDGLMDVTEVYRYRGRPFVN